MCLGVGNSRRRLAARPCQDCSYCTFNCGGDLYARKVDLLLPDGRSHYRTCAGTLISALVLLIFAAAALLAVNEMMDDNSFTLQRAQARNWYDPSNPFPCTKSDESL